MKHPKELDYTHVLDHLSWGTFIGVDVFTINDWLPEWTLGCTIKNAFETDLDVPG